MDTSLYPLGIQSFEQLRTYNCVYVDKTKYIWNLTRLPKTYFLSRPRRFGKSLLLSTIEAYFKGKKELFEGLAISNLERKWEAYPVIHFDFSRAEASDPSLLHNFIVNRLIEIEDTYGITDTASVKSVGERFGTLISRIYAKTGKQVVVLIDEYDKGIHEVLDNAEKLRANQEIMRPFFSQIKAFGNIIRFAMITGVARFRHFTLFSGFNNPDDISMDDDFAAICGITENELLEYFDSGLKALSEKLNKSYTQVITSLRLKYDGYRFSPSNTLVYNPFSLINCFKKKLLDNYWISSGSPKVFVDYLTKSNFDITEFENLWVTKKRMENTYSLEDPVPLLFQTGYLTIGEYDDGNFKLQIPNGEVRSALVDDLIPKYMGINQSYYPLVLSNLKKCLNSADIEGFMSLLQSLVAKIPYHEMNIENIERTYHLVIYEIFLLMGLDTRSEIAISGGRIDMVVGTYDFVYVMEFKLGGSVDKALKQIDKKGYALPWSADKRKVHKIGIVFSPETRTIEKWKAIECL